MSSANLDTSGSSSSYDSTEICSKPQMSQEMAKKLFTNGGVLVFLHLPVGSIFGIDMEIYRVAEKFRGVKMIPPGFHFIHYSSVSKEGETGPRNGFFHYFAPKEILVKKWDRSAEDLVDFSASEEETEHIRNNLQDLDKFLGPYPYHKWKTWIRLTCNISEPLLKKLQPLCGTVSSVPQLVPLSYPPEQEKEEDQIVQTRSSCSLEDKYLPKMDKVPGTEIRFTEIPKLRYPSGSSAAEITKHYMDSTFTLDQLLATYSKPEDILGELQTALVCFLYAHIYEAYEHWKKIVEVLCFCDSGLKKYSELFNSFLSIFYFQIKEVPVDFFVDIVGEENFLLNTLQVLFQNIKSSDVDPKLHSNAHRFEKYLTSTYKWNFESIPEDEQPVIVELDS